MCGVPSDVSNLFPLSCSLFLCQYQVVLITTLKICLNVLDCNSSSQVLILQMILVIHGLLCFQMKHCLSIYRSVKNVLSILIGITLNLHIAFDNMDILMILTLLIQGHGLILHFFKSSISLFNVFLIFLIEIFHISSYIYSQVFHFLCLFSSFELFTFTRAVDFSSFIVTNQVIFKQRYLDFLIVNLNSFDSLCNSICEYFQYFIKQQW